MLAEGLAHSASLLELDKHGVGKAQGNGQSPPAHKNPQLPLPLQGPGVGRGGVDLSWGGGGGANAFSCMR